MSSTRHFQPQQLRPQASILVTQHRVCKVEIGFSGRSKSQHVGLTMISEALRQSTPEPDASPRKPGQEFDTPKKHRVFALLDHRIRLGLSKNDCFNLEGVPTRTGRFWEKQRADKVPGWDRTTRTKGTRRTGRPQKIPKDVLDSMILYSFRNDGGSTATWDELHSEFAASLPECCAETIRRAFQKAGYNKCKYCRKTFESSQSTRHNHSRQSCAQAALTHD